MVQLADVFAVLLLVGAAVAFGFGNAALARADDLKAVYWLLIGVFALRGAVQVGRPGAKT